MVAHRAVLQSEVLVPSTATVFCSRQVETVNDDSAMGPSLRVSQQCCDLCVALRRPSGMHVLYTTTSDAVACVESPSRSLSLEFLLCLDCQLSQGLFFGEIKYRRVS